MKLNGFDPEDDTDEAILWPDLPIIDAHHHLWPAGARIAYDAAGFAEDLGSGHKVIATVFVECMTSYRPAGDEALRPVGETEFVVSSCAKPEGAEPYVGAAIVGWADLRDPRIAERTLQAHIEAGQGRFSGVRHNVVWHEQPKLAGARYFPRHLLMESGFRESLAEVGRLGLTYDVWALREQLGEVAALADALPSLTIVLNHIGGPVTFDATPAGRAVVFRPWQEALQELARRPNVHIKFGGLGMANYGFGYEARARRPGSAELAMAWSPYFDVVIGAFGADRCMFESNFPVDKQSASYRAIWNAFKRLAAGCTMDERKSLFSGTAQSVYRMAI